MRPAIKAHDVDELSSAVYPGQQVSLQRHLVGIHGWNRQDVAERTKDGLEVDHADEHDDLRRGVGAARGIR